MTRTPPDRARRMDEARRSLKAAMITISHAQTTALAVAATPDPATLVLHVAKNRNGRAGESVELLQQGWLARISSLAKPSWGYSDHNERGNHE